MPLVNNKFTPLELPAKHCRVLTDNTLVERNGVMVKKWRYRCLHGGRNGAKDWSASAFAVEDMVRFPKRYLFTREILNTIKDSAHQLLKDTISRLGFSGYFDPLENEIRGVSGSSAIYRGLRDLNAENIKSLEGIDVAVIMEAQTLTKASFEVLDPTIRKPNRTCCLHISCQNSHFTASSPFHVRRVGNPYSCSLGVILLNSRMNHWPRFHSSIIFS